MTCGEPTDLYAGLCNFHMAVARDRNRKAARRRLGIAENRWPILDAKRQLRKQFIEIESITKRLTPIEHGARR